MFLPDSFLQLLLALGAAMNAPTRVSWVTVVKGWLFAGRRTLTGVLVAAGAVGHKHHSAYCRVFATARWSLDALGLALLALALLALAKPLLEPGAVPLTLPLVALLLGRGFLVSELFCYAVGMALDAGRSRVSARGAHHA